MGFFDDINPLKALGGWDQIKENMLAQSKMTSGLLSGDTEYITDPVGKAKEAREWAKRGGKDPDEEEEEDEEQDVQRQQEVAGGISEPGYADPGVSPEDREAFDAEAWREQMVRQTNDFIALNTRAMDTRDRILLRPIQTRDTLRYGGTSSVQDALPLQLVHSANVV